MIIENEYNLLTNIWKIMGVLLIFHAIHLYLLNENTLHWVNVKGEIIHAYWYGTKQYNIQYKYNYNGNEHVNDRVSILSGSGRLEDKKSEKKYIKGTIVEVFVNPNSPSEAVLEIRKFAIKYFYIHIGSVIIIAFLYFWYVREYRLNGSIGSRTPWYLKKWK